MIDPSLLWIPFTLAGAAAQVARNAAQRGLTPALGTIGATHVRFLFGFPFALIFLALVAAATGERPSLPPLAFWPWLMMGALTQIIATALMLAAMAERSFVVTTAYLKTEPIQVAIFGFLFLGDALTAVKFLAIVLATAGVMLTVWRPGTRTAASNSRPTAMGLAAAAIFALSAIGFRGAVLNVPGAGFVMAATTTLVLSLLVQTLVLTAWLAARSPSVLLAILRAWRPSLLAGFFGALASQFWFLAFALTAAANVRTLALVEVPFAQGVARYGFKQRLTAREGVGIAMIVIGVAILIAW